MKIQMDKNQKVRLLNTYLVAIKSQLKLADDEQLDKLLELVTGFAEFCNGDDDSEDT